MFGLFYAYGLVLQKYTTLTLYEKPLLLMLQCINKNVFRSTKQYDTLPIRILLIRRTIITFRLNNIIPTYDHT